MKRTGLFLVVVMSPSLSLLAAAQTQPQTHPQIQSQTQPQTQSQPQARPWSSLFGDFAPAQPPIQESEDYLSKTGSNQYHWSMLGHYNLMEQKVQKSQGYYEKLLASTNSLYPYRGYVPFLFATGQFKLIVSLIPKLEKAFAEDLDMQLMFAQALAETGNNETADKQFIDLQHKYKENTELTYLAAQAHAKKDPKQSIVVIDEFLDKTPFQPRNCIFYFLKSQYYLSLNEKDKAIESVQKSLDICPRFDKGWLLLGMLQEQQGKINEAIKGYSTFLEITGPNKQVEQQISTLLIKSKMQQSSPPDRKQISYLTTALTLYENKEYEKALSSLERSLKQEPGNQQARLLKINLLSAMGDITSATNLLQTWMSEEPNNESWFKALHLLYKAGLNKDVAIKVLHAVEQKHPSNLFVALYLADVYTRTQLFPSAIAYHEKALTLTNDLSLKTKIAFNLGMIYHQTNDIPHMKETLERAAKFGPQFPPLNNLLAYYHATYGRDLTRAQQYLDQALAKDAGNPHFLDTQAVIWYKQREYKKAEELLQKLAAQEPRDYFIQLHLAKTEHKLGKQRQSIASLNKALGCAQTEHEKTACKTLLRTFDTTA